MLVKMCVCNNKRFIVFNIYPLSSARPAVRLMTQNRLTLEGLLLVSFLACSISSCTITVSAAHLVATHTTQNHAVPATPRQRLPFDYNWLFKRGEPAGVEPPLMSGSDSGLEFTTDISGMVCKCILLDTFTDVVFLSFFSLKGGWGDEQLGDTD